MSLVKCLKLFKNCFSWFYFQDFLKYQFWFIFVIFYILRKFNVKLCLIFISLPYNSSWNFSYSFNCCIVPLSFLLLALLFTQILFIIFEILCCIIKCYSLKMNSCLIFLFTYFSNFIKFVYKIINIKFLVFNDCFSPWINDSRC